MMSSIFGNESFDYKIDRVRQYDNDDSIDSVWT